MISFNLDRSRRMQKVAKDGVARLKSKFPVPACGDNDIKNGSCAKRIVFSSCRLCFFLIPSMVPSEANFKI